jgi:ring-1,2-phenylacetyl-CoA epoxidase subunit PaaD
VNPGNAFSKALGSKGSDTLPLHIRRTREHDRELRRSRSAVPELWNVLDEVADPEIPVVSIWELGVLQDVTLQDETVLVTITPTYSGCPAMSVIAEDIAAALARAGYTSHRVIHELSPAWTTDWIAPAAREKLRAYGIAPPRGNFNDLSEPQCPHCGSESVRKISEFGSTACKALYACNACAEPFDYFKTL